MTTFTRETERPGRTSLARNTLWMLVGQAARTLIQAAYFILVARSLDPAGYGAFAAVMGLVLIGAPFATMGAGLVMIKNVAREQGLFPVYWGNSLLVIGVSGCALLLVMWGAAALVLPPSIPALLVLSLGLAELVLARVAELCAQVFQAFQLLKWTAAIHLLLSAYRLLFIAILYAALRSPTPLQWGFGYLTATFLAAATAVAMVHVLHGRVRPVLDRQRIELREGAFFSISLAAQSIYNDIDKTMLSRLSTLDASGVYGAAYRIIEVAFSPVSALLSASYAHFFQAGTTGVAGTTRLARRLFPVAAAYSVAAGVGLVVAAPLVPLLLGPRYAVVGLVLMWLAPLLLLRSCHCFLANVLTGAGHQRTRSVVQVLVAVFNVLINLWLIPAYSWKGAAWASLATDGLLALGLLAAIASLGRRP